MQANAQTIKTQKALKKHITRAKSFHSIDNMWNPKQPSDSTLSIIQEEKGFAKSTAPPAMQQ